MPRSNPTVRTDFKLRRELCQVPITAIAIHCNGAGNALHVLAGEDGDVAIYDVSNGRLRQRICVFSRQPIHGIHVQLFPGRSTLDSIAQRAKVLVWGASSVAMFCMEDVNFNSGQDLGAETREKRTVPLTFLAAPDWIYAGCFSPFSSEEAVLITAHNALVMVTVDEQNKQAKLGLSVVSPSRPMLYAADVVWTGPDEVLVAAGTVFGDILVWKYRFEAELPTMLFSLSGHEGSIFGVDISTLLKGLDGSSMRLLASCSDDRTIRVWDISEHSSTAMKADDHSERSPVGKSHSADTGFRCAPLLDESAALDPGRSDVSPVAIAMGHASRIWGVQFGDVDESAQTLSVFSFGEDATTQRWSMNLSSGAQDIVQKLDHLETFHLHDGKHLWGHAVMPGVEGKTIIATGGADSKIMVIERRDESTLNNAPNNDAGARIDTTRMLGNGAIIVDVGDIFPLVKKHVLEKRSAEIINRYDFITLDSLLAVTNHGRLIVGTLSEKQTKWQPLDVDPAIVEDLSSCYIIRAAGNATAILGTTSGNIYYFSLHQLTLLVAKLPGRVVEINLLSSPHIAEGESVPIEILVHLHGASNCHYLTLDRGNGELLKRDEINGLDSRFIATSAAILGDILAVGSRHGWLSILRRPRDEGEAAENMSYESVLSFATRSRDAITSLVPLPPSCQDEVHASYLLATSRDGHYRIYQLLYEESSFLDMRLIHETSPPFGPMIEGAWFTKDAVPELILYGFKSKNFIVWNETHRQELLSIECGGAHRTFRLAYSDHTAAGRYRFAFTRTSKLCIHFQDKVTQKRLKPGTHGREIRAISSNGQYIATGAEDTSIRLWEYDCNGEDGHELPQMRYLACIKTHVTGIQRVKWLGDEHLFTSAGNEEFFVWRIRRLDSAYAGVAVMCEGMFEDKSVVGDLRIMDFDVLWHKSPLGSVIVSMAFSNSMLKTYLYKPSGSGSGTSEDQMFKLLNEASYTGACLTQARQVQLPKADVLHVLTAATDGHIALWASNVSASTYELVWAKRVHQSSVKSLDMVVLESGQYGLLTGGDDNALAWTIIETDERDCSLTITKSPKIVRPAHAAAINGVVIVTGEDGDVTGVSVSNDQQIKSWRLTTMELLSQAYSGVADAGDLAVLHHTSQANTNQQAVIVGGVGLEVWRTPAL